MPFIPHNSDEQASEARVWVGGLMANAFMVPELI